MAYQQYTTLEQRKTSTQSALNNERKFSKLQLFNCYKDETDGSNSNNTYKLSSNKSMGDANYKMGRNLQFYFQLTKKLIQLLQDRLLQFYKTTLVEEDQKFQQKITRLQKVMENCETQKRYFSGGQNNNFPSVPDFSLHFDELAQYFQVEINKRTNLDTGEIDLTLPNNKYMTNGFLNESDVRDSIFIQPNSQNLISNQEITDVLRGNVQVIQKMGQDGRIHRNFVTLTHGTGYMKVDKNQSFDDYKNLVNTKSESSFSHSGPQSILKKPGSKQGLHQKSSSITHFYGDIQDQITCSTIDQVKFVQPAKKVKTVMNSSRPKTTKSRRMQTFQAPLPTQNRVPSMEKRKPGGPQQTTSWGIHSSAQRS